MTHVVTEKCVGCKHTTCAVVCPVEAFHEGPEMLYINPDVCIDCEMCVVECPVDAIFHEDDLPKEEAAALGLNSRMAQEYPVAVI